MSYVAGTVFNHVQAFQNVSIGYAAAAVGEHHVLAGAGFNSGPNGVSFAPMRPITEDFQRNSGRQLGRRHRGLSGGLGGLVAAAVIDDDNLTFEVVALQEYRCG